MPSLHSSYGLRVILIVSAYFYMDMNCFGLARVVSSWLQVGSVAADSFGWVVADGFGWLRMVPGGFKWFWMVSRALGWFAVSVVMVNILLWLTLDIFIYLSNIPAVGIKVAYPEQNNVVGEGVI